MLHTCAPTLLHIVIKIRRVSMHACCDAKYMLTEEMCDKWDKHYCSGAGPWQKGKCSSRSCTDSASDIRQESTHCHALPTTLQREKIGCKAAASNQNQVTAGQSVSVDGGNISKEAMDLDQTRAEGGQNIGEAACSQLTIPICGQQPPCKRMKIELKQDPQRLE